MNFRFVVIAIYALAAFSCSKGCAKPSTAPADSGCKTEVLTAVHTSVAPKLDGEGDEKAWLVAKPTRAFSSTNGGPGRPHAEVRASWDDSALYLLFYAGDEDLEEDDSMGAALIGANGKTVQFTVSPKGTVNGAKAIQAAVDADGSMADAGDDDEEWLVEAAIPWALMGKTDTVHVRFTRHDRPKGSAGVELTWPEPCGSGEIKLAADR